MRNWHGNLSPFGRWYSTTSSLAIYAVLGIDPQLVFDFANETYVTGSAPQSFAGAITHSASSNATMVDSDGLLKWRPHNLLRYSEQFDNAAWAKSGLTTTANATTAPDGTATAEKVVVDGSSGFHRLNVTSQNLPATPHTLSAYFKAGEYTNAGLGLFNGSTFAARAIFDLSNGTVSVTDGAATISDVGNGWYRCSITGAASATTTPYLYVNSLFTYTGDGTSGIYIWGAHLYRSDLGGMVNNPDRGDSYVPTTSSAVYLPRRGHHVYNGTSWVNEGLLHESEARTNLVTNSNNATSWSLISWASVTTNQATSPDGLVTAFNVAETAGSPVAHIAADTVSFTSGVAYTQSIFLKKGSGATAPDILQLTFGSAAFGSSQYANYNISTGEVLTSSGGTALIEDFGNGWYRCIFTATATATASTTSGLIFTNNNDSLGRVPSYAGSLTSDVLVYGFQLEQGSTPSSYIPTSGATVTRAAETLTVPAANLPWPSPVVIGEELVTNGTFDTDLSDWLVAGDGSASSTGGEASIVGGVSGNTGIRQEIIVPNGVYRVSVGSYGGSSPRLAIYDGTASGILRSNQLSTIQTVDVQITSGKITIFPYTSSGQTAVFDNISVKEINPLSVSIQMQGEMVYADEGVVATSTFYQWRPSASDYIETRLETDVGSGEVIFVQRANSVSDAVSSSVSYLTPSINVPFNIASRHGSTFINGATDGTALTADTTPVALPDLSATDLQLGFDMMGTIKLFRIWADDLGDAGIAEAST